MLQLLKLRSHATLLTYHKRSLSTSKEIITSVLYGSKKEFGTEEDRQTHSKLLARGKYVHELSGACDLSVEDDAWG